MRYWRHLSCLTVALALLPASALAQSNPDNVTSTRRILALSYPEGPTISIKLEGTSRLPKASGEAKVERKRGSTEIEVELDELKPATYFGGDYNTYVLWVVSPEGQVDNVGEFILRGNRSKLNVTTPLETFGLFVTAEPHFLVSLPSRFVVLENTRPTRDIAPLKVSELRYRGFEGIYNFQNETLANFKESKGEVRSHLESARTSVELAERSQAEQFAPEELAKARDALRRAEAGIGSGASRGNQMLLGNEVVRLAVEAQDLAERRSVEAALEAERQANASRISELQTGIQAAEDQTQRARLEAQQRELKAQMEASARREADARANESARRAAEAERRAEDLARAKKQAELEANRSAEEADALRKQREEARAQLQTALSRVAEVRDTARGLIVNLPNILFDFNKATLKPQGREILAKITGILLVAKGYKLSVEGHTDSVGSDDYNQKLSEKRAQSVSEYLISEGVSPEIITTQGFGESNPMASNDTADGREKNRRVEIVVNDGGGLEMEVINPNR